MPASLPSGARTFLGSQKETPCGLAVAPPLPPSLALETTELLSVSVGLPVLGTSCEWEPTLRGVLCPVPATERVPEVHPHCKLRPFFKLKVSPCIRTIYHSSAGVSNETRWWSWLLSVTVLCPSVYKFQRLGACVLSSVGNTGRSGLAWSYSNSVATLCRNWQAPLYMAPAVGVPGPHPRSTCHRSSVPQRLP